MAFWQYFGYYFALEWLYVHVIGVYVGKLLQNGLIHVLYAQNIFYDHFIVKKGQNLSKMGAQKYKIVNFEVYIASEVL